mmetsp:Transcript_28383/g.62137  ORF Transcript_28383/g.62137 Transcript_28383/m.62137 type:complete len:393 (+) Transcript_28383:533-1711(+)
MQPQTSTQLVQRACLLGKALSFLRRVEHVGLPVLLNLDNIAHVELSQPAGRQLLHRRRRRVALRLDVVERLEPARVGNVRRLWVKALERPPSLGLRAREHALQLRNVISHNHAARLARGVDRDGDKVGVGDGTRVEYVPLGRRRVQTGLDLGGRVGGAVAHIELDVAIGEEVLNLRMLVGVLRAVGGRVEKRRDLVELGPDERRALGIEGRHRTVVVVRRGKHLGTACVFVEEEADEELAGEVLRVCELALAAALDPVDELRDGLWPLGLRERGDEDRLREVVRHLETVGRDALVERDRRRQKVEADRVRSPVRPWPVQKVLVLHDGKVVAVNPDETHRPSGIVLVHLGPDDVDCFCGVVNPNPNQVDVEIISHTWLQPVINPTICLIAAIP